MVCSRRSKNRLVNRGSDEREKNEALERATMKDSAMRKECRKVQEILNRFHDREASTPEYEHALQHIDSCANCREVKEDLEKISLLFRSRKALRASSGFADRVIRGISKELVLSPWEAALPMNKRLAVAAAIVMMISFSLLAFRIREGNGGEAESGWKGFLSSHTFSSEERAVLFGEGLTPEYARKILGDSGP
jgi:hypothetical protein